MARRSLPTLVDEVAAGIAIGDISPRTMQKWRVTGDGPPFMKIGNAVRYSLDDLAAYLERQRRTSTSDSGR